MKTLSVRVMKSVILSLLVLSSWFLIQCNNISEKEKFSIFEGLSSGVTKISGYIHNRDFYPNMKDITINVSHVSGQDRVTLIKSPINDDGTFCFEIDLSHPQDVTMQPYIDFLYLIPGDSLHIEIDFKNFSNVKLSGGKSVEINSDFLKYFDATGYSTTYFNYRGVGTDCEMNCSWAEIIEKMNEERNDNRKRRQEFLQKNKVCDEVVNITESMIELDYYQMLVGTISLRKSMLSFNKETMDIDSLINELNKVADKYFNTGLYSNSHFKFIGSAYLSAARFVSQPDKDTDFEAWANEITKTDIIKDFMLTVIAGNYLLQKDLDSFVKISEHINNEYLLDRLTQEYKITRANMINPENVSSYILGKPKDFTGTISFNNNNFLPKIIASNSGKVQVINLSAAWCSPCKPVLEQLATLMKEYSDEEVSFHFICVSADDKKTRNMYSAKGIDEAHVHFVTTDEYYFLSQTFFSLSFPYGILVNKKGVVVDYGSHVRPEAMLREKIDLLLKQYNLIK